MREFGKAASFAIPHVEGFKKVFEELPKFVEETPIPPGQVKLGGSGENIIKDALARNGMDYNRGEVEESILCYPKDRTKRQKKILSALPREIIEAFQKRFLEEGREKANTPKGSEKIDDIIKRCNALEDYI